MKKLFILTNQDERCGNYQYAVHLEWELRKYFQTEMGPRVNPQAEIVVVNWHPARVTVTTSMVGTWQAEGKKVLLILQNSFHERVEVADDDILFVANAVVAHEPMDSNAPITYIPHGIPEIKVKGSGEDWAVGTAGFLFPWKRPDVVINIAYTLGMKANIICPPYDGLVNPDALEREWSAKCHLHMVKDWLSEADVIDKLSYNTLNCFWFESKDIHDQFGQTGSARMGLAAKRPIIISRHRKFRTLFPYEDELYIADTELEVHRMAAEIIAEPLKAKIPKRVLEDMSWTKAGLKYKELIESL